MKISSKIRSDIRKVLVITTVFILASWYLTFYNDNILRSEFSLGLSDFYDLKINLLMSTLTGLMAGIFGGWALVKVNEWYFRKHSYGYSLFVTFLAYTVVFYVITISMSFINARMNLGPGQGFDELFKQASIYMFSAMMWIYYFFWGSMSLLMVLFLQISDKFGPGMLSRFLTGKYHRPREEQRIFMFMDMRSSTTIAEKIGSNRYFNLLNELFTDITDPVLSTGGEIYQYVGDEVVVSWNLEKGIKQSNCISCFIKIKRQLKDLAPYYNQKYGVIPEFKAGIHYGTVTAGEIGTIKKDIAYSGDVLNTTSRIQEHCNHYEVDFLISGETLDLIEDVNVYEPRHLGNIELRGRKERVDLNTLNNPTLQKIKS